MKVVFCGGGTAGHIYPAIAMAEIIKKHYSDAEFLFIGREDGDENEIPKKQGFRVETIPASGIDRRNIFKAIGGALKSIRSIGYSRSLLKDFHPGIVIGTGGYVSWPVLSAAIKLKIPTLIHESNAIPGLTTRLLAKKCNATLLGFENASLHLEGAKNIIHIGNPVRHGFKTISKDSARRRLGIPKSAFVTLSFGGSLGSSAINDAIIGQISDFSKSKPDYIHIHSTGRRYYNEIISDHPELQRDKRLKIVPFIKNMTEYMCAADLAITRSGAITISELGECTLPSILIPSPNVTDDHQRANAESITASGGAIMLDEADLSSDALWKRIGSFYENRVALGRMKQALISGKSGDTDAKFLKVFNSYYAF